MKLASEASQENFSFLTLKNEEMAKLEHLICPKVGGGGTNPLVPLTFESAGAQAPAAPILLRPWKPWSIYFLAVNTTIIVAKPHSVLFSLFANRNTRNNK